VPSTTKASAAKKTLKKPHTKTYAKVKVSDLNVDHDVQRMYDPARVTTLEATWNQTHAGTIVVSKRADGSLYVIDGQHRKEAKARQDPDGVLDAEIHEGLTRQEEAEMFLRLNRDRKAVRPFDNYRVALVAGMPNETRVHSEVTARNLEVSHSPSANRISAVQAMLSIVQKDKDHDGLLGEVLDVAESAWGRTAETWDNMVMRALATVIHKNRGIIDLDRLATILRKHLVGQWKAAAVNNAVGGGGSESRSNRLVEVIVTKYNSGLRTTSKYITN